MIDRRKRFIFFGGGEQNLARPLLIFLFGAVFVFALIPRITNAKETYFDALNKANYTAEEKNYIVETIAAAHEAGLNSEYLQNKVVEAAAKHIDYKLLTSALEKFIQLQKSAIRTITLSAKRGFYVKNRDYCIAALTDYMNQGVSEAELSALILMSSIKKQDFNYFLYIVKLYAALKSAGFDQKDAISMVSLFINSNAKPQVIDEFLSVLNKTHYLNISPQQVKADFSENVLQLKNIRKAVTRLNREYKLSRAEK